MEKSRSREAAIVPVVAARISCCCLILPSAPWKLCCVGSSKSAACRRLLQARYGPAAVMKEAGSHERAPAVFVAGVREGVIAEFACEKQRSERKVLWLNAIRYYGLCGRAKANRVRFAGFCEWIQSLQRGCR